MTNAEIARVFARIATALEIDGANPFRIRAYQEAARVIETHPEPVQALTDRPGALEAIRGIGKDLAAKIRDVVATGTTPLAAELDAKYSADVLALTTIPGLGPKRVRQIVDALGVRTRADLEAACRAGKVRALPRVGESVEQKILAALAAAASEAEGAARPLLAAVWIVAHELAAHVRAVPGVEQVEIAGSFRRRRETVGDLDLLACGGDAAQVMAAFTKHRYVAEVLGIGDTKASVRLGTGLQVDLRVVPPASFGAALIYFTGSKAHNIELRKIAIEKGWSLNEYALTEGERVVAGRTEAEVYRALGLDWIPPELRESCGEVALAAEGRLPKLVEAGDLRADLHMHTHRSDGRETIATMLRAAQDRGYEYVAITEHSQALAMARGFDAARVRQSVEEIAAARREVPGIRVLHGLEVDILADGALDLDDDSLALLDWVIVSIHSRFDQPPDEATARVLRALAHPSVHAMGHPLGRKIGRREGLRFDLERVLAAAVEHDVALEINAQPPRLDLPDVHARRARELGARFVIDTDAHAIDELDYMPYGVFAARRAGLTRDDVLNTLPFDAFDRWRAGKRAGAGAGRRAGRKARPNPVRTESPAPRAKRSPARAR